MSDSEKPDTDSGSQKLDTDTNSKLTLPEVQRVTQLILATTLIGEITLPNRWARKHSAAQISKIMASIKQFGFINPIIIDPTNMLVAGEARLQAARQLGHETVPTLRVGHLTNSEIQAYRIADNKLADGAGWNADVLRDEVAHLLSLDFDPQALGFDFAELDQVLKPPVVDVLGDGLAVAPRSSFVRSGDLFAFGRHRLLCGDALSEAHGRLLMGDERAAMSIDDFPFNVPIGGHVSTLRGSRTPREFAQASGEMSSEEFKAFLSTALGRILALCRPGAIIEGFIDWRSIHLLIQAAESVGLDYLNLVVWKKHSAGMGSLFRSQHELIAVLRAPGARHTNHVELGKNGRHRTNVWEYEGRAGFSKDRQEELDRHPTPKPVSMYSDAILDVTRRGDIVLDMFAGGGTTAIACQRTGRAARLMEIDPIYCEASLVRYRDAFGEEPIHVETGLTLTDLLAKRADEDGACSPMNRGEQNNG